MCGIAGILTLSGSESSGKQAGDTAIMTRSMAHRGPDGESFWQDPGARVFFGHRRLAVIDRRPVAAQPMHYANRFTIVFNGEIYNYQELRQNLLARGYLFYTDSDTEVILAAYQAFGASCVEHLDGMFAFAIWDSQAGELFFARDRMGEKPLFFCWQQDRLLFASEMKAFWAVGVAKEPDPHQLLLFLGTGVTGIPLAPQQSFYTQIFQLPAAHTASYSFSSGVWGELAISRYWDLHRSGATRPVPPDRYHPTGGTRPEEKLVELLKGSIQKRLRADVPIGSSLSGGVDSSTIAALVKELGVGNWTGFSAVFPGFEKDESTNIAELTKVLGIQSHTCTPTATDQLADLDRMLYHQEVPVESASALVQYKVMKLAADHGVTVLLDGQGADELLAGYPSYIHWFLQEIWRSGSRATFNKELKAFKGNGWEGGWGWRNRLASWFPHVAQEQLIEKQAKAILRIPSVDQEFVNASLRKRDLFKPFVTSLNDILYYDLTMGRLPELLRYADRNSMAFGREIRLPYLDPNLMEYIICLPPEFKMQQGFTKWILRKSLESRLPKAIAWQTKKIGYEPPQDDWMKNIRVQEMLMESRKVLVQKGILQKRYLDRPYTSTSMALDWRMLVLGKIITQ